MDAGFAILTAKILCYGLALAMAFRVVASNTLRKYVDRKTSGHIIIALVFLAGVSIVQTLVAIMADWLNY